MDNKIKFLFGVLFAVTILGCTTTGDQTGSSSTNIVISIEDPNVGVDNDIIITAQLSNGWEQNIGSASYFASGGTILWKPERSGFTWADPNPQTGVNVLSESEQIKYKTLNIGDDAFPGTYSLYATYCFAYQTTGYQRVKLNTGTIADTPTNGYDQGPLSISFGGIPKINVNVQDSTSLQFTFDKVAAGTFYSGDAVNANKNKMYEITMDWDPTYLKVISAPGDFDCGATCSESTPCDSGTCTASEPMMVSDKYTTAFEFLADDTSVVGETETAITLAADYVFCIDSNTININVIG
jgi:hypothetical protein